MINPFLVSKYTDHKMGTFFRFTILLPTSLRFKIALCETPWKELVALDVVCFIDGNLLAVYSITFFYLFYLLRRAEENLVLNNNDNRITYFKTQPARQDFAPSTYRPISRTRWILLKLLFWFSSSVRVQVLRALEPRYKPRAIFSAAMFLINVFVCESWGLLSRSHFTLVRQRNNLRVDNDMQFTDCKLFLTDRHN